MYNPIELLRKRMVGCLDSLLMLVLLQTHNSVWQNLGSECLCFHFLNSWFAVHHDSLRNTDVFPTWAITISADECVFFFSYTQISNSHCASLNSHTDTFTMPVWVTTWTKALILWFLGQSLLGICKIECPVGLSSTCTTKPCDRRHIAMWEPYEVGRQARYYSVVLARNSTTSQFKMSAIHLVGIWMLFDLKVGCMQYHTQAENLNDA